MSKGRNDQGNESRKELLISVFDHFGRVTIRPENDLARKVCDLLRQKTLTERDIAYLKEIGFSIKQKEREFKAG